jgi:outer membrane murein-binding lipoprotein Lpp
MHRSRASGAAVLAGLLLLAGCGGDSKITDAKSPQAKACRAAIATRIIASFKDVEPGTAEANFAMQRALSGEKPEECSKISDALGAQMIAELGAEHDQLLHDQEAGTLPTPIPRPH